MWSGRNTCGAKPPRFAGMPERDEAIGRIEVGADDDDGLDDAIA
jgi:hypothetical protein